MGARLLRQWVAQPLKSPPLISARLEAVDELLHQREIRRTLGQCLEQVGDLERLIARICCLRANARDMVALARSLDLSPALGTALSTAQSALLPRAMLQRAARRQRAGLRNPRRPS